MHSNSLDIIYSEKQITVKINNFPKMNKYLYRSNAFCSYYYYSHTHLYAFKLTDTPSFQSNG